MNLSRCLPACAAMLGAFFLTTAPLAAQAQKAKVVVLPYAPLYESIPRATGERIADTLKDGLGSLGAVEVVSLPREGQAAPSAKAATPEQKAAIEEARAAVERGKEQLGRRRVGPALAAFTKAIELSEKNVTALEDVEPLLEAYLKQAATLFLMGREDEAAEGPMTRALLMRPSLVLQAGDEYGQPYIDLLEKVRERLAATGAGSLRVDTTPPGAGVWVDGREALTSPVLITGLLPGAHYVKIKLPSTDAYTELVEIRKDQLFRITPDEGARSGGAEAQLIDHLVQNQLDESAKSQVRGIAQKTGAQLVVVGGAYAQGADIGIVSFLYSTQEDAFTALQPITLDRDMLGATIEINKIATELGERAGAFGAAAALPRPLAAGAKPGAEEINEVDFSVNFAALKSRSNVPAVGPVPVGGSRRPVGGPRRPVGGGGPAPAETGPGAALEEAPAPVEDFVEPTFNEDFGAPAQAPAEEAPRYTYSGGVSIEDEISFGGVESQPAIREGGLLSKWWFWTAAAAVVGGTVGGVMLLSSTDNATPNLVWK